MSEASSNRELGRQKVFEYLNNFSAIKCIIALKLQGIFFVCKQKLFVTSEYDKYMKSQASSDGETASMTNQSLYSIKSSVQSGPTMKKYVLMAIYHSAYCTIILLI